MKKIIILRGIQASGKSSWAYQWVSETENRVRINRDSIRLMAYGKPSGVDEMVITKLQDAMLEKSMRSGLEIVVDNTNLKAAHVKQILKKAHRFGYEVEFKDFDVTLEEAIERDKLREVPVGEKVIESYFNRYFKKGKFPPIPTISDEVRHTSFIKYEPNEEKPKAYIFDIDGTLAHINPENPRDVYDASRAIEDVLDKAVSHVLEIIFSYGYSIVIVSGRSEDHRLETEAWIDDNDIYYADLFMRPSGDTRNDSVVKHELFYKHIADNYNVVGVFDDRDRVVEMWREIGLKCFQVQPGDF